jgi:hypothetical protein
MGHHQLDLNGKRFGRLTVISKSEEHNKYGQVIWLCKCDCGNEIIATTGDLNRGHVKSCGCLQKEKVIQACTKHNESRTRLYRIWSNMKCRCYSPKATSYENYGGRGICICDEWLKSYQAFSLWAKNNGYNDSLTIDRKNDNGNYEPSNCEWKTLGDNSRKTRRTVYIEAEGIRLSRSEWARKSGISTTVIARRLKNGMTPEEAVTKATRGSNSKNGN